MQRSVISLKAPKALVFAFGFVLSTVASAVDVSDSSNLDLSLEELMSVVVTSVSKKEQTLAETAAAVHVITADDIRRSGATNVPEALRLAPGVQVAAIGNNKWAVAIRGFADRFSSKLLVLVDGRSVYTPLFSGVFWEGLSVPLEEIERIEVMRGPGAAIWGSNAVNGVINIITRSAHSGQGQLALATGSELKSYAFARQAWRPDPDTAISVHARMFDKGSSQRRLQVRTGIVARHPDAERRCFTDACRRRTVHLPAFATDRNAFRAFRERARTCRLRPSAGALGERR